MDLVIEYNLNTNSSKVTSLTFNDSEQFKVTCDVQDEKYKESDVIYIDGIDLKKFPRGIGSLFPNLVAFSLTNCNIKDISFEDFADLGHLKELNLSNNLIVSLRGNVFNNVQGLNKLIVAYNKIKFVDVKLFDALPNLEKISFYNNTCISKTWSDEEYTLGYSQTFSDTIKSLRNFISEVAIRCKPQETEADCQQSAALEARVASLEAEIKAMKTLASQFANL
jgi:Leucine rich repeat